MSAAMKKRKKKKRAALEPWVYVIIQSLYRAITFYPLGSKKHKAVMNALFELSRAFDVDGIAAWGHPNE